MKHGLSAPQPAPRKLPLIAVSIALFIASAIGLRGAPPQHRAHLSGDLLLRAALHSPSRVRVIVHGTSDDIHAIAQRHHLTILKQLADGAVFAANGDEMSDLAADAGVGFLSGDPIVHTGMSVSNVATAADQTRAGAPGLLGIGAIPGVSGAGIGVAVLDSGIGPHTALAKKVVASVSTVTGDPSVGDAFGHGTHVAGIIAGSATSVTPLYNGGIAPGVQLINVRVLGANGAGYTSDVIAGIDWAIANQARYNIRIINLSVGHSVMESAADDPLCQAVARAAAAGIVVIAAAGNDGRTPDGARVLGGISSPGNSPYAITVGAINTGGTASRSDDTIADYSSRGPTKFDFAIKPDLAAPGTRIISSEAPGALLPSKYPYLHRAGVGSNAYMQLSGTSMATPIVSGAVALLLQGAPGLTASQIKLALQAGATFMPDDGLTGGGAGSINIWASRKITTNGLSALGILPLRTVVGGSGTVASGLSFWDINSLASNLYHHSGIRLLDSGVLSQVWNNPALLTIGKLNIAGLLNPIQVLAPNPMLYGGSVRAMGDDGDEITWGSSLKDSEGNDVVWGTSDDGDEITWGSTNVETAADPR
jgi:serine protease AprX